MKLLVVQEIKQDGKAVTIVFKQGQKGIVSTNKPEDYEYYLRLAQRSLERQHPVGVDFANSNIIVEITRADNDFPVQLEEYDKERMKVVLQGHDGIFYLRRDHPDFKRITEVLRQSISKGNRVWFVASKPDLLLADVIPVEQGK